MASHLFVWNSLALTKSFLPGTNKFSVFDFVTCIIFYSLPPKDEFGCSYGKRVPEF